MPHVHPSAATQDNEPTPAGDGPYDPSATELRWPTAKEFLTLRCPICWQAPMFRHPLGMNRTCSHCGYTYDRGHGYFLGAMFGSYAIVVILEALLITAMVLAGLTLWTILAVAAAAVFVLGPLIAFPFSRLIWVMTERRSLRWGEDDDDDLRAELDRRRSSQASQRPR